MSGEATAHAINNLATWMIENPLEESTSAAAAAAPSASSTSTDSLAEATSARRTMYDYLSRKNGKLCLVLLICKPPFYLILTATAGGCFE